MNKYTIVKDDRSEYWLIYDRANRVIDGYKSEAAALDAVNNYTIYR